MNKLQLYIAKSHNGYKSFVNVNPDEDVRHHVADIREVLDIPRYDPTEKTIFYLIKYIAEGAFLTVIRTIPSQPGNHLAAWIFKPHGLQVPPDRFDEILKLTTRKVAGTRIEQEDLAELRSAFSTEYPLDVQAPATAASAGTDYAFRFYGGDTGYELSYLTGDNIYQTSYLPYAGVLLIDAALGIDAVGTDLTDEPVDTMVTLLPPEPNSEGFAPNIFGSPFTSPVLVPLGGQVEIVWHRPGFEDIRQNVTIEADAMQPAGIATAESKKTISPRSFAVTSLSTRQPLTDECSITVNGVPIDRPRAFTLSELANASVTVSCDGYLTYTGRMDLASSAQAPIQMRDRQKIYKFELPAKSSDIAGMIGFEIHSKHELTDSPIDGYILTDEIQEGATRTNHLIYDGGASRSDLLTRCIWALGGLIVGLLIMWMITGRSGGYEMAPGAQPGDSVGIPHVIPDETPVEKSPIEKAAEKSTEKGADSAATQEAAPTNTSNEAAINYLDTNKVWKRSEMEQFPLLAGLYDDMNKIDRHRLVEHWGPRLLESRSFAIIVEHSQMSYKKKAKLKGDRSTYNAPDDESINVTSYLNAIDP